MSTLKEQIAALNSIADNTAEELALAEDMTARNITLNDILSPKQITDCLRAAGLRFRHGAIVRSGKGKISHDNYNSWVLKEIVEPNVTEINERLNDVFSERGLPEQENDAHYLAYAVTYVIEQLRKEAT